MPTTNIYRQNYLTFIVTPERIVVKTNLGQQFYLQPKVHYWNRRLKLIRTMIQLNEIRDLNELASWCASGNIAWEPTTKDYAIDTAESVLV